MGARARRRGHRIVKLLLNISNEEQRVRFLRRCDLPEKHWKFSATDIREREHWDDYQHAFSEMLSRTSTEWAPWHVIPADRKWFARLGGRLGTARRARAVDPQIPRLDVHQRKELDAARAELVAEAPPAGPATRSPPRPAIRAARRAPARSR